MDSFLAHHPDGIGYVLYLDDVPLSDELRSAKITALRVSDLKMTEFDSMRARYNTFELCNALKPFMLQHLIAHTEHQNVCYFDSDIFIFGSLKEEVWDQLDVCSVLLTPHLCQVPGADPD